MSINDDWHRTLRRASYMALYGNTLMLDTEESQPMPSTEELLAPAAQNMIGLRAMIVERSYGLTVYQTIHDQDELLNNPDIPVYPTLEKALSTLSHSIKSPVGTRRVFRHSEIPHEALQRLPYELRYEQPETLSEYNHDTGHRKIKSNPQYSALIFVTDVPLIATTNPQEIVRALRLHRALPLMAARADLKTILSAEPLLMKRQKSTMWGLPTLALRKLTRAGTLAKKDSPTKAAQSKKHSWMVTHSCLSPSLHRAFHDGLKDLLSIPSRESMDTDPKSPAKREDYNRTPFRALSEAYNYNHSSGPRSMHPTWLETADACRANLDAMTRILENVLKWHDPEMRGDVRSPTIYLRRHHREETLLLLSLYAPILHGLSTYPDPDSRIIHTDDYLRANQMFRKQLLKFAWAMGCRTYPALPIPTSLFEGSLYAA